MHGEIVKKELEEMIKEGKGCIVIDFGGFLETTIVPLVEKIMEGKLYGI